MSGIASGFWHHLRDTITHSFVGGVVLLATGLVPEEWLAHAVARLHVSAAALHLWSSGLDVRFALALFGVAFIVGDIFWRRRPRPAAATSVVVVPAAAAPRIADPIGGPGLAPVSVAAATPAQPSKPSVAVMPFANLSGDPEQDYFVDGMVLEIVEALSRIRSIFVIGGGSTLFLKGKAVSPQDVGRQFGVRYVLEGSVRKAGDRIRGTCVRGSLAPIVDLPQPANSCRRIVLLQSTK